MMHAPFSRAAYPALQQRRLGKRKLSFRLLPLEMHAETCKTHLHLGVGVHFAVLSVGDTPRSAAP
jgi:hypothetical protein